MKDYVFFEREMEIRGLSNLLVSSHLDAAFDNRNDNIVYIRDEESGSFDIYLTAKKDGAFGEYVCWVSDEFVEDSDLIYLVLDYVIEAYTGPGTVEENLRGLNPNIQFNIFPEEYHKDIYEAMNSKYS